MIIIFWEMTPCGSYKTQKMIIIIVTAVETSNLTKDNSLGLYLL
jgi:hypothetical protein